MSFHRLLSLAILPIVCMPAAAQFQPGQPAKSLHVPSYMLREDKVHRYLEETFSPSSLATTAIRGTFNQLTDGSGDWGSGDEAYTGRVASTLGQHVLKKSIRFGLDSALDVNSRYRPVRVGGFWPRMGHALAGSVTATRVDGSRMIGVPAIAGAYGTAFAANLWYPQGRNGTQDALMRGSMSLGITAGKNVVREFWPDIKRMFKR